MRKASSTIEAYESTTVLATLVPHSTVAASGFRIGVDPISRVYTIANNDEAYDIWRAAQVANPILIHIDAHPDLEWIEDEPFINIANFICPAIQEGLVGEVYWIVPDPSWNHARSRRELIQYLRELQARYPGPHPRMRVQEEETTFGILDTLVHVRPLQHFPSLDTPVFLDIDTDFLVIAQIPDADDIPPLSRPWCWPENLIRRMREHQLRAELVTIAYSVEGGYTSLRWKYLGDELADRLRHPQDDQTRTLRWTLQRQGVIALVEGRLQEASQAFQTALAREPETASLLFGLAELAAKQGLPEDARTLYQRALMCDPSYCTTKNRLALCYLQSGQLEDAEEESQQMLTLNPQDFLATYILGQLALRRRQWNRALALTQQLVTLQPDFINGYQLVGEVLERLGRLEEATAAYEHVLKLGLTSAQTLDECCIRTNGAVHHRVGREHFDVYRQLSALYARLERIPDAILSYRMWIAASPHGYAKDYLELAKLYVKQRTWKPVMQALLRAAQMAFHETWNCLRKQLADVFVW